MGYRKKILCGCGMKNNGQGREFWEEAIPAAWRHLI